jgi:flagellar motor switch protein FliN/FliY
MSENMAGDTTGEMAAAAGTALAETERPLGTQAGSPPGAGERSAGDRLSAIYDIPVQLAAVLGKTSMPVNQLLRLGRGAVVELDRKVGEPIDIYVNNRLVARGEVLIVDDHLGITMTEIIKSDS